jgi:hypothetical protein
MLVVATTDLNTIFEPEMKPAKRGSVGESTAARLRPTSRAMHGAKQGVLMPFNIEVTSEKNREGGATIYVVTVVVNGERRERRFYSREDAEQFMAQETSRLTEKGKSV